LAGEIDNAANVKAADADFYAKNAKADEKAKKSADRIFTVVTELKVKIDGVTKGEELTKSLEGDKWKKLAVKDPNAANADDVATDNLQVAQEWTNAGNIVVAGGKEDSATIVALILPGACKVDDKAGDKWKGVNVPMGTSVRADGAIPPQPATRLPISQVLENIDKKTVVFYRLRM